MNIDTHKGNTPAWVGVFFIAQICALWFALYTHKVSIDDVKHRLELLQNEVRENTREHEMEAAK